MTTTYPHPPMDLGHWIALAKQALRRRSLRMAELYMRRALEETPCHP